MNEAIIFGEDWNTIWRESNYSSWTPNQERHM